ncbi:hypothetical protein PGO_082420 [Plasmodium gonderi]|uniref:RING-type domain-containing protein n=1 Tax=Plasmodium gonderi TaxID=77519 RepID=A0A1Y1JDW3_PLAGO|nr:hypothetical protein PGO_082420 [Plasmodium gonderi]GAW80676.1 hypothetical protein PGO_082420 [Plasmodium gonderi]
MFNNLEKNTKENVEAPIDSKSGSQEENSEEKNGNTCLTNREKIFYDISEETEYLSVQTNDEKIELNNFYDLTEVKGKKDEVICICSNSTNDAKNESSGSLEESGKEETEILNAKDDQNFPTEVGTKHGCNTNNCSNMCYANGKNGNESDNSNGNCNESDKVNGNCNESDKTNGNCNESDKTNGSCNESDKTNGNYNDSNNDNENFNENHKFKGISNENNNANGNSTDENNKDINYREEEKNVYVLCNICDDVMEKSILQDHLYAHTIECTEQIEPSYRYERQKNLNPDAFETRDKDFCINISSSRNKQNKYAQKRSFNNAHCAFSNSEIILSDNSSNNAEEDSIFDMLYNYNTNLYHFRNNPVVINKRNNNSGNCMSGNNNKLVNDGKNNNSINDLCEDRSSQNIIEIVNHWENEVEDILPFNNNIENVDRNITKNERRNFFDNLETNATIFENYLYAMRESLSSIFYNPDAASSIKNSTMCNNIDNHKNEEHSNSIIANIYCIINTIQTNIKRVTEKLKNSVNSINTEIIDFLNKNLNSVITDINNLKGTYKNGKKHDTIDTELNKKLKKIYKMLDNMNKKINTELENIMDILGSNNNHTDDRESIVNSISRDVLDSTTVTIVNSTNSTTITEGRSRENIMHMNNSNNHNENVNNNSRRNNFENRSSNYRDKNSNGTNANCARQNNFYNSNRSLNNINGTPKHEYNNRNRGGTFHHHNTFSNERFFTGISGDSLPHAHFSYSPVNPHNPLFRTEAENVNDINYLYSTLVDRYPCICENSSFSHFDNNSNNIWPLRRVTNNNAYRAMNDSPNSRLKKESSNINMNVNIFTYHNRNNNDNNNTFPINNASNTSNHINRNIRYNLINNGVETYTSDSTVGNPFLFVGNRHNRNARNDIRTNHIINTVSSNYSFMTTNRNGISNGTARTNNNRSINLGSSIIHNENNDIGTTSIININNLNCVTTNSNYNNNRPASMAAVITTRAFPITSRTGEDRTTDAIAAGPPCRSVAPFADQHTSRSSSRSSTTVANRNSCRNSSSGYGIYIAGRGNNNGSGRNGLSRGSNNNSGSSNNSNNNNSPISCFVNASSVDYNIINNNTRRISENLSGTNLRREQTLTRSNERHNRVINRNIREMNNNTPNNVREHYGNRKLGARAKLKENNDYLIVQFDIKKNENNNLKICSICYENYQHNESLIFLPCTHNFHKTCIIEWINKKSTCPICKINIKNF